MEYYLGIYSDGTVAPKGNAGDQTDVAEKDAATKPGTSWEPFRDFCKRRFLWYFESYLTSINEDVKKHHAGVKFKSMPFEHKGNAMDGEYEYVELRRRLLLIRRVLDQETLRWAEEGALALKQERPGAAHMQLLYKQTRDTFKASGAHNVEISLDNEQNPYVWIITLFGRPRTNLDGGMFRIRFTVSPEFPEEWPRVVFETELFHQRVTKEGVLCYVPRKPSELPGHVEALVSAVEEEHPPYDPRVLVNLEASKLFWGSEDDKKQYSRRLRRSVQRSVEG